MTDHKKNIFKGYFQFDSFSDMQNDLYKTKNIQGNEKLVQVIRSRLSDLRSEYLYMSEKEG